MAGITVNGKMYKAIESVKKLSDLVRSVEYEVVEINDRPTRYNAYVVTVSDATNEFKVYMPEYVAKNATPGKCFIYNGLQPKNNGTGHSYHQVLWADC